MKTQFDLYTAAEQTARLTMNLPNVFEQEKSTLDAFEADNGDPADWPFFSGAVLDRRNVYNGMAAKDAPSVIAAKAAAKTVGQTTAAAAPTAKN